ncbi:MAG: hypothetical protein K0U93_23240 [Gammaproteobacteria bacterium]|nr:hypothetical protein [Gammaproteobacteria bacterium]
MKYRHAERLLIAIGGLLLASSCAWIPSYVSEPGVTIERVTTSSGRVSSAHFWEERTSFALRGEITPQPITKGPMGGHVDVAVTAPDGVNTECSTTRQRIGVRHVRKQFSIRFDELPALGSVVRVKHHNSANHEDCDV